MHMQGPFLPACRPKKGHERPQYEEADRYVEVSRKRFYELDRKMQIAKATQEDRKQVAAEKMWDNTLMSEEKEKLGSKEAFVEGFVRAAMESYVAKEPLRRERAKARIDKGYEKQIYNGFIEVNDEGIRICKTRRIAERRLAFKGRLEFRSTISKLSATLEKATIDAKASTEILNLFGMYT
ncbi:hypothetical protein GOP47_0025930 [Adiantum capillus-veneris]|uniref:Uncharacterized protein n=1 Tax=Adiantum capillus-veneris TaxID=13818 RepID=A0A9D4U3Q8_ADICA|nr:hypothetical protein GOP47_0025930 [Adiantum capillus-veneris]